MGGTMDETDGDPRDDDLGAVSRLFSLGHDRERLAELAPKIRELFGMINKVRAAGIQGHEMAVNYPTSVQEWFSAGSEGVPLLPPEGQPPRAPR
jgi:hypothetical protein